jgi:lysophospholipase L1-like esterase
MHRRATVAVLYVVVSLVLGLGVVPADAAGDLDYVALGDSYSSGVGAPDTSGRCARSPLGYPTLWAADHPVTSFQNVTCGGAVTDDALNGQIDSLGAETDLVTITIGGNDVGFAWVMLVCTFGSIASCEDTIDEGLDNEDVDGQLVATYAAIGSAAPDAEILVLGYPRLFEETPGFCGFGRPSLAKRILLNDAADQLNQKLEVLATAAGLTFIDVRDVFDGHGLCGDDPWVNPLSFSAGSYHPNADGYRDGYLVALEAALG